MLYISALVIVILRFRDLTSTPYVLGLLPFYTPLYDLS